jgi:hypothetical protein
VEATPLGLPTEVRSLSAVLSGGDVKLTWLPPLDDGGSPILKYKIFRSSGTGSVLIAEVDGAITEYMDTTASAGKTYLYRVVAVNSLGDGSEVVPVEIDVKEEEGLNPLYIAIPAIVVLLIIIGTVLAFLLTRSKKEGPAVTAQAQVPPAMAFPPPVYRSQLPYQGHVVPPLEPQTPAPGLAPQDVQTLPPAEQGLQSGMEALYPPPEAAPEQAPSIEIAPEPVPAGAPPAQDDPLMSFYKAQEEG